MPLNMPIKMIQNLKPFPYSSQHIHYDGISMPPVDVFCEANLWHLKLPEKVTDVLVGYLDIINNSLQKACQMDRGCFWASFMIRSLFKVSFSCPPMVKNQTATATTRLLAWVLYQSQSWIHTSTDIWKILLHYTTQPLGIWMVQLHSKWWDWRHFQLLTGIWFLMITGWGMLKEFKNTPFDGGIGFRNRNNFW